jgi:arylsulfatase A-like enzyme
MFSNSSRTIESIPDLMLSMPTERHGVYHNSTPAPQGLVTIAEALHAAGHATASFCTNVNAGPRQGMAQGFETFVDKISSHLDKVDRTIPLADVVRWIEHHRDRPMFIYVHTAEPHSPYTPPEGFRDRFDPEYAGSFTGEDFHDARHPRDIAHIMALYDEELVYADARLGIFLDALQEEGLLEHAHLFVTSDHGEEFLQHNDWEHGRNLHNEETCVPLVACGPSFDQRGRVDTPAQLFDIMPTILEMYDLPAPYPLEGQSLLSLLRSNAAANDALGNRSLYASNHNYRIDYHLLEYTVVENGRWKLMLGAVGPSESGSRFMLFDLAADPRERRIVLQSHPDVARRLAEQLIRWRCAQHVYDPGQPTATIIDPAHMAELEALGYLGDSTAPDRVDDRRDQDPED